jgi:hypothetical protein
MIRSQFLTLGSAFLLLLAGSASVRAGSTDPTLAIGEVVARPAGPAAIAEVTGLFGFDDVVQVDFPVTVVAYSGTTFMSYTVGTQARTGSFAGLSNGLTVSEVADMEAAGTPSNAVEILRLDPNRITLSLPPELAAGPVSFVLHVTVAGEGTFLSNVISVDVGAGS